MQRLLPNAWSVSPALHLESKLQHMHIRKFFVKAQSLLSSIGATAVTGLEAHLRWRYEACLIQYGIVETRRHAQEAHRRYSPVPGETCMPIGTGSSSGPTRILLIDWDFTISMVHIAAPMRESMLLKTAKSEEIKNV